MALDLQTHNMFTLILSLLAAGDDYTKGPYMVTFSAGQSEVSFQIPTANDSMAEGNEAFHVDIVSTCGPRVGICSPSRARIVIVDNDSELNPVVSTVFLFHVVTPPPRQVSTFSSNRAFILSRKVN